MIKLIRNFRVTLLSIVLMASMTASLTAITVTQSGCKTSSVATTPGRVRDENLIRIALACKDITEGVTFGIKVKRALLADGKITQAVSSTITTYLTKVQQVTNQIAEKSEQFDTFTAGKGDLFKLYKALSQARTELAVNGTIPNFSGIVTEILAGIDLGIGLIEPLFR